jgi:predicted phage terminase large subunit-like protein
MTRWSVEDIVGRMLDPKRLALLDIPGVDASAEQWDVIELPALALPGKPDLLNRKEGESIFPERWTKDSYLIKKATSLTYIWSAMYDCSPVIMGGNYIPVAQIQIVSPSEVPPDMRWCRAWDLATDDKKINDETAGIAGAVGPDGTLYLKDLIHDRWKWPEARDRIAQTTIAERIPVGIEAVAGFKTAFANLQEVLPPQFMCIQYGVDKNKLTRALPWIALVPKKKLALVQGPWNVEFLLQAERFSGHNDDEDDYIDAVSGVYQMLLGGLHGPIPVNINDRLAHAQRARRHRALDG